MILWQRCLDASGFDDCVAPLHAFDGTGDDEFLALQEIIENLFALRVTDLLQDDLLSGLRADAPELYRFERLFDEIVDLEIRVPRVGVGQGNLLRRDLVIIVGNDLPAPERLVFAGLAVDLNAHIHVIFETLLRSRSQGKLKRAENNVLLDILFARQRINKHQQLAAHF